MKQPSDAGDAADKNGASGATQWGVPGFDPDLAIISPTDGLFE